MRQILIVADEKSTRKDLRRLLECNSFAVSESCSFQQATTEFTLDDFDVIITDLRLPDQPGTDLIRLTPTPVLVMTSHATLCPSADSLKIEAIHYLSNPLDHEEILESVTLALEQGQEARQKALAKPKPGEDPVPGMVGSCPAMVELFRRIRKVAQTDSPVLILGESGTGKELVARALHEAGTRREARQISVNCAAIPEDLIESELFGHEKGAFNGATSNRTGLVEAANNGTLFLDEIGELPLDAQARLLRVLQEQEIRKVGSVHSQKVDVRLVAATHRDLKQFVKEGRFREDLFYRINVMPLQIPPLRERETDILELADMKLASCCSRLGVPQKKFSDDAIQVITTYPWPGNVRELENVIERAVIMTEEDTIDMDMLGLDVQLVRIKSQPPEKHSLNEKTKRQENQENEIGEVPPRDLSLKDYFERFVLEHQDNLNETELAKKLGISRKCLWERRQRFNIPRKKKSA